MSDQAIVDAIEGSVVTFFKNRAHMERSQTAARASKKTKPMMLSVSAAKMLKENEAFGRIVSLQTAQGFYAVPLQFIVAVQ